MPWDVHPIPIALSIFLSGPNTVYSLCRRRSCLSIQASEIPHRFPVLVLHVIFLEMYSTSASDNRRGAFSDEACNELHAPRSNRTLASATSS